MTVPVRHKTALLAVSALALAAAALGFRSQGPDGPEPVGRLDGALSGQPHPQPYPSASSHPGERWTRAVADLLGP